MILDVVIRSTRKLLGNVGPPVSMVLVKSNENGLFVIRPLSFLECGVQMVDESVRAQRRKQMLGEEDDAVATMSSRQQTNDARMTNALTSIDVPLATLLALSTGKVLSNLGPLSSVELTFFSQDIVFFRRPGTLSLDDRWAGERLPLGKAIDGGSFGKIGRNIVPSRRCCKKGDES